MKIIKINKNYRSHNVEAFLVLFGERISNDDIECAVEEWCENEPSGQSYGYAYNWEFVKDELTIHEVLNNKIQDFNFKIENFQTKINEIEDYLKLLNI